MTPLAFCAKLSFELSIWYFADPAGDLSVSTTCSAYALEAIERFGGLKRHTIGIGTDYALPPLGRVWL